MLDDTCVLRLTRIAKSDPVMTREHFFFSEVVQYCHGCKFH